MMGYRVTHIDACHCKRTIDLVAASTGAAMAAVVAIYGDGWAVSAMRIAGVPQRAA